MRVLVCGDRNWTDRATLERTLDAIKGVTFVIEGGARGADRMGREWAQARGIESTTYAADWARFGRGAGPIRNKQMLYEGQPDLVVAFHNDIATSKGTANMVEQARKQGVRVRIVSA